MDAGPEQQLRSLRDFLRAYNALSELCFRRCVCGLGHRLLSAREELCLDRCAGKLIRSNHRVLSAYVGLLPHIRQRQRPQPDPSGSQPPPTGSQPKPEAPDGSQPGRDAPEPPPALPHAGT